MVSRTSTIRVRVPAALAGMALVVSILLGVAGPAAGAIPPPPSGAVVVAAGQPPRQCVQGDPAWNAYGVNNGVYWSKTANAWLSAPWCYPRWGFLEASGSGVVAAGQRFTVTAIPTDGSNSGQYAPETKSISWRYPGKRVSGCGSADLSCTVVPTETAGEEWSWYEFQVSMPRTFFIDSPGEFCAGQHLCPGATTHAWAWVGVPPRSQQRHIRGTVRDADGKGVAGVVVTAAGSGGGSDRTDAAGSYLIVVKKGSYTVSAGDRCVVGKPDCATSKRVTVPPSGVVDFQEEPEICPLAARASSARRGQGRKQARPRVNAGCLRVAIGMTSPHKGTASAGDRIKYVITPTTKNRTGTVLLTVTMPDKRHARIVAGSITGSHTIDGSNIVWRLPAASLRPVSFSVIVRSDAKIADPWAGDDTIGIVATAVQGQLAAPTAHKQLDLLPCGQQPAAHPSGFQSIAASGWTAKVEVDSQYGLALANLRLTDLDGGGSRLVARRVSVPYLQVRTTNTTAAQFDRLVRLAPDSDDAFGRSRLLSAKLTGTTAGADSSQVVAVYGIDHLGPKSGSCLLVRLSYQFKRFGTDTNCHPTAKIGYGDIALLKCSQFRPLLEYRFRGADGEKLREIQTAQRLHLDLDGQARSMAMVEDRDLTDLTPTGNPILKRFVNPVTVERRFEAIVNGKAGPWDNFHQRATLNPVDLPADLTDGIARACGECFHMHWRWGRLAGGDLPGLGGTEPLIPEGSTQSAYVQLSRARASEEGMSVDRIGANVERWTPANVLADGDVALHWIASNTQQKDAFFTHWTWVVPRSSASAGVTAESFAVQTPRAAAGWFCPIPST
jgi:hypothetical protein